MRTGFTCGAFDLLHLGHIKMLKECRALCDILYVGLHTNPAYDRPDKNRPAQTVYERFKALENCPVLIDKIIPYDTELDLANIFDIEDIQVRFVGSEYALSTLTGHEACKANQIQIVFNRPRRHTYSSSELRHRIKGCSLVTTFQK